MRILCNQKWISNLLFLCVLLPAEIGAASPKHALGLQLGGAYVQNRDALGSPFRYGGGVKAFGLMYRYRGVSEHTARINIAFGSLTPRSKTFEKSADYFFGNVQYGYFRPWSRFHRVKWGGIWNAADWVADIDIALEALKDAGGMVLDVRNNSGGNGLNLFEIAGRFADYEQPVIQSQTRNGPGHTDFTDLETWSLRPQGPFQYTRPTVVLANQFSSSAAELFVLILRTYPHVTVIGSTTAGAMNANIYRELPNGWVYRISTGRVLSSEGERVDGKGLSPDIHVPFPAESAAPTRDPVLDAAIKTLTE